ncbi:MAG TPA: hypothetical protein DET40_02340 [Lentisphaeria bacterium]|nr:MAG: hypothetical protein A2X45_16940 [Lentisphaerae bacterium GWF2_50_93]HCE42371.1 hypothetical protein [Lentisphaeria bacterium]
MKKALIVIFSLMLSSCNSFHDRLQYDTKMPLLIHSFENSSLFISLPYPIALSSPKKDELYSNAIRTKRVGTAFVNDFDYPLTDIMVFRGTQFGQKERNAFKLNYSKNESHSSLFRNLLILINNKPICLSLNSSTRNYGFTQEENAKITSEDNELFLRLIDTIRIKGDNNKWFKVAVNEKEYYENIKLVSFENAKSKEIDFPVELLEIKNPPEIIADWNANLTLKIMYDMEKAGGYLYYVGDKPMTKNLDEVSALCRKALNVPESTKVNVNIDAVVVYNNEIDSNIRGVFSKNNIEIKHVLVSYIDYLFQRYDESQKQKPAPLPAPDDKAK